MIQPGEVQKDFRPGLYRHSKSGNLYSAVALAFHHDGQRPMVLYVSLMYGTPAVRPLYGWPGDEDAWLDTVDVDVGGGCIVQKPRFEWVEAAPTNTVLTMVK